jgi:glutaredoxin 3
MGHITIFTLTKCPHCAAAKALLAELGLSADNGSLVNINVQSNAWRKRQLPSLVSAQGALTMPQIFFGSEHIGGNAELQALHTSGGLKAKLDAALQSAGDFPPPFPEPTKAELLADVPVGLREKWAKGLKMLDKSLGGDISSLLIMIEGPREMIVLCTEGEKSAVETYAPDAAGPKGSADGEEMLYCQVALENNETLFIDDPAKFPGLEKNEDYVKYDQPESNSQSAEHHPVMTLRISLQVWVRLLHRRAVAAARRRLAHRHDRRDGEGGRQVQAGARGHRGAVPGPVPARHQRRRLSARLLKASVRHGACLRS